MSGNVANRRWTIYVCPEHGTMRDGRYGGSESFVACPRSTLSTGIHKMQAVVVVPEQRAVQAERHMAAECERANRVVAELVGLRREVEQLREERTITDEMAERAAKAIYGLHPRQYVSDPPWRELSDDAKEHYRIEALAVLGAALSASRSVAQTPDGS